VAKIAVRRAFWGGGLAPNRGKRIVFLNQASNALLAAQICRNMARRAGDGEALSALSTGRDF